MITAQLECAYAKVLPTCSHTVSWAGSTLDTAQYLPAVFLDYQRNVPFMIDASVEDWQIMTRTRFDGHVTPACMMSNLITVGLKHHYRHVTDAGKALIINKFCNRGNKALWGCSDIQYPDPPNQTFLVQEKTAETENPAPPRVTPAKILPMPTIAKIPVVDDMDAPAEPETN